MRHFAASKNPPLLKRPCFGENLHGFTTKPSITSRFIWLPRVTKHYRLLDEGLVSLTGITVNSHRHFKVPVPSGSILSRAYLSFVTVESPPPSL
jgi:hypothetical protein